MIEEFLKNPYIENAEVDLSKNFNESIIFEIKAFDKALNSALKKNDAKKIHDAESKKYEYIKSKSNEIICNNIHEFEK